MAYVVVALVAHLPVVFKLVGVVGRVVAVEIVHGDHGDLRIGRGVVKLRADRIQPRNRLRRKHVGKIAYIVGGLGQARDSSGHARKREEMRKEPPARAETRRNARGEGLSFLLHCTLAGCGEGSRQAAGSTLG